MGPGLQVGARTGGGLYTWQLCFNTIDFVANQEIFETLMNHVAKCWHDWFPPWDGQLLSFSPKVWSMLKSVHPYSSFLGNAGLQFWRFKDFSPRSQLSTSYMLASSHMSSHWRDINHSMSSVWSLNGLPTAFRGAFCLQKSRCKRTSFRPKAGG